MCHWFSVSKLDYWQERNVGKRQKHISTQSVEGHSTIFICLALIFFS